MAQTKWAHMRQRNIFHREVGRPDGQCGATRRAPLESSGDRSGSEKGAAETGRGNRERQARIEGEGTKVVTHTARPLPIS